MQTKIKIVMKPIEEIKVYENNPRNHGETIEVVKKSIKDYGFVYPILVDKNGVIVDGEACFAAATELSYKEVPCIIADELTDEEVKEVRLIINKSQEFTSWDFEKLSAELEAINIDMSAYKFPDLSDIDLNISDEDFLQDTEIVKDKEKKTVVCPECGHKFEV